MAPPWDHRSGAFPALVAHSLSSRGPALHVSGFGLGWDGRSRRTGVHRRAASPPAMESYRSHCAASGNLPHTHLCRQILIERSGLDTPSGLSGRSTASHGLGPQRQSARAHRTRGAPHQQRAATWLSSQCAVNP